MVLVANCMFITNTKISTTAMELVVSLMVVGSEHHYYNFKHLNEKAKVVYLTDSYLMPHEKVNCINLTAVLAVLVVNMVSKNFVDNTVI